MATTLSLYLMPEYDIDYQNFYSGRISQKLAEFSEHSLGIKWLASGELINNVCTFTFEQKPSSIVSEDVMADMARLFVEWADIKNDNIIDDIRIDGVSIMSDDTEEDE